HTPTAAYPLSTTQQGMLFHSLYARQSGVYIQQMLCALHEEVDVPALQRAWQRVVDRHPILRSSFHFDDLSSPQKVYDQVRVPCQEHDCRPPAANKQTARLTAFLETDRLRDFVQTDAPLLRLALFRFGDADARLLWTYHHALL